MRISVNKDDPGYENYQEIIEAGYYPEIFLNGVKRMRAITADEDLEYIIENEVCTTQDRIEINPISMSGKVEIRLFKNAKRESDNPGFGAKTSRRHPAYFDKLAPGYAEIAHGDRWGHRQYNPPTRDQWLNTNWDSTLPVNSHIDQQPSIYRYVFSQGELDNEVAQSSPIRSGISEYAYPRGRRR